MSARPTLEELKEKRTQERANGTEGYNQQPVKRDFYNGTNTVAKAQQDARPSLEQLKEERMRKRENGRAFSNDAFNYAVRMLRGDRNGQQAQGNTVSDEAFNYALSLARNSTDQVKNSMKAGIRNTNWNRHSMSAPEAPESYVYNPVTIEDYARKISYDYDNMRNKNLTDMSNEELEAAKERVEETLKSTESQYSFDNSVDKSTGKTLTVDERKSVEDELEELRNELSDYEDELSVRKSNDVIQDMATAYAQLTPEQEEAVVRMWLQDNDEKELANDTERAQREAIGNRNPDTLLREYEAAKQELEAQGVDAEKMLNYYSRIHNRMENDQKTAELAEKTDDLTSKGVLGFLTDTGISLSSVMDSMFTPFDFIDQLGHSAKNLFSDEYDPYDPYSATFTQSRNRKRTAVSNDIDSDTGKFLYDVGMSMADSAAAMGTGSEALSLGVMAANSGAQSYVDATERGVDTNRAALTGISSAASEATFEKLSLDHFYGMINNKSKTTIAKKIVDWAVQSGIEGSEEVMTDFANEAADHMINGGYSQYEQNVKAYESQGLSEEQAKQQADSDFWKQVKQDFLAGTLSGAVFGGVAHTANAMQYHHMGTTVNSDAYMKESVLETAGQMEENSTARRIVDTVKPEAITDRQMGQIVESMANSDSVNLQQVISKGIEKSGVERRAAEQQAQEMVQEAARRSQETQEEAGALAENMQSGGMTQQPGVKAPDAVATSQQTYGGDVQQAQSGTTGGRYELARKQTGVTGAVDVRTGKPAVVVEIAENTPKKTMVKMSDGSVVDLSTVEITDENMRNLYDFAATFDDTWAGNALIKNYGGESMSTYLRANAVFYNAGRLGKTSFESLLSNPKNANMVAGVSSIAMLQEMYFLGENQTARENVAKQSNAAKNAGQVQKGSGKVIDNRKDKADNRMYEIAKVVAEKTGLDISLNDTLESGEQGHFAKALSQIALSHRLTDGKETNEYTTLVHELNEFAESYDPEGMQQVLDAVLDYAMTKEGAERITESVEAYQKAYRRVEADKAYQEASEEFVFDYLAGMFSSKAGAKDFSRYMSENRTEAQHRSVMQTVADFFREIYNRITNYLSDHVLSYSAKMGLNADAKKARQLRRMVMDVWAQAEQNYRSAEHEAEEGKRRSIAVDTEEMRLSEGQREFFKNAKTLDESGRLKRYYHGTARADRVGTVFRADRATSGPMAFFTDDKKVAENYAKDKADTSIEYDEAYDDYYKQFRIVVNGNNMSISEAWNHLPAAKRNEIKQKAPHVTMDWDEMEIRYDPAEKYGLGNMDDYTIHEHKGNMLSALTQSWLEDGNLYGEEENFLEVLKLVGLEDVTYMDPNYRDEKVYEAYLNITNPFDTANISEEMLGKIRTAAQSADYEEGKSADMWDKNNIRPELWMERLEDDIKNGTTYSWTSIPDFVTDVLKENGYDGILDQGGKGTYSTYGHQVAIPFYADQIKNVDNLNPTKSEDIRYSMYVDEDGIENYTISDETRNLSYKERKKKLLDIMKNQYRGRTAKFSKNGEVYYAQYDNAGIRKGVYGDKKSDKDGFETKIAIGADGNYIELAENALYSGSTQEQGKITRNGFHENAKTWDYFVKTIKSGETYFDVLVNVKDTGNSQYVYDITLQKKKEELPRSVNSSKGDLNFSGTVPKNTVSHTNSTVNIAKKLSLNVDEDLMAAMEEYSSDEKQFSSIIEAGFRALDHVQINKGMMRKIALDIKTENKSRCDTDTLAENLTRVFAYLKDTKDVSYEDMTRLVQEVALPVLEESVDVDETDRAAYERFRADLKGRKIRLNAQQKKEVSSYYGSYEDFRKRNFGAITFSEKGDFLNDVWEELCDSSSHMLEYDAPMEDRPILLVDALAEMKPARHNIFGMDRQTAAYDLALDIYRRFFIEQAEEAANKKVYKKVNDLIVQQQEFRKRTYKEYKEKIETYREKEAIRRQELAEEYVDKIAMLDREYQAAQAYQDAQAQVELRRQKAVYQERLADARRVADNRVLKMRVAQERNRVNKRNYQEAKAYRERIKKNAQGIITYFNQNTDKKYIPEGLKAPVAEFITSLDFISDRANPNSAASLKWYNSMNGMKNSLESLKNTKKQEEYAALYAALMDKVDQDGASSTLLEDMTDFLGSNYGVRITDMNTQQLRQLDNIMSALKRTINSINQLYVNERSANVAEIGDGTIADLQRKKTGHDWNRDNLLGKAGNYLQEMVDTNMMDARSFFYRLGENGMSIYQGLRDGFSKRVWKLNEAQDYMQDVIEETFDDDKKWRKEIKKWTGKHAEVHSFEVTTFEDRKVVRKKISLTTAQIMSLYELRKRQQALMHITHGGVKTETVEEGKNPVKNAWKKRQTKGIPMTEVDIDRICDSLTKEQKEVADKLQRFLAQNCAEWGNETTMQLYGYQRYGGRNYFPIKVDGDSIDTRDQSELYGNVQQGFTKKTAAKAQNAIVIQDIFRVFTEHVVGMATYSSYTAPLMDAMKWFNYRQKAQIDPLHMDFDEQQAIQSAQSSVKNEMSRVYGASYQKFFTQLIIDINGERSNGANISFVDKMVSNMKAASVGANMRVIIQQPTAYLRAGAVMNPKYLLKAMKRLPNIKKAQKNSAIALWKSWGYFESSIGKSMETVVTGQMSRKERVNDILMKGAQKADDMTWGVLWNACEEEIMDQHPDVEYDSEEFLQLTAKRMDDVVDQTQVVDSVLHRSQIMRSKNEIYKAATSFMSEPTKSWNMLANSIRDFVEGETHGQARKTYGWYIARVAAAYVVTATFNAMAQSLVDAFRNKDDDDTTYWERWLAAFQENWVDNVNPLNLLPFVKDIWSIKQGYDINRLDMQAISKLCNGGVSIYKYINNTNNYRDTHTVWDAMKPFINGLSQFTGIPAYNITRDLESVTNTVVGHWDPDWFVGGIKRTKGRQAEILIQTHMEGDTERYEKIWDQMEERGMADNDIHKAIRTKLKDQYLDGEVTREEAEDVMRDTCDMSDNEIFRKIREWEGEDSDYAELHRAIDAALESGQMKDRDPIFDFIKMAKENGKEPSDIARSVTTEYKPKYLEAKKNHRYADIKNLLISVYMYLGYTWDESKKKVESWEEEEEE